MLDSRFFNEEVDALAKGLAKRNSDPGVVVEIRKKADHRRTAIQEVERLKAMRNRASEEIAAAKKKGESAVEKIEQMKAVSDRIKALDTELAKLDEDFKDLALQIPNIPHPSVPEGKGSSQNLEIRKWGVVPEFNFPVRDHVDLGERLGILDLVRATKISGARFSILRGAGAKLERALMSLMLDMHTKEHGYEELWVPFMVNRASGIGTGNLPKFEQDLFRIESIDCFLVPTAEVPVTNFFRDEILEAGDLPKNFCAYTPCFRSEAGSYGKDVRGLIRQHQFDKVEIVKFVRPERSEEEHEKLLSNAEAVLQRLGLPYRVMLLCGGDMGFSAAKCYDIEVWLPSQGGYREISSCSNFGDFQARRASIRFRDGPGAKPRFVHTLNGSGLAIGRTWLAILENYQEADGSVRIPEALQPYMGLEKISVRS